MNLLRAVHVFALLVAATACGAAPTDIDPVEMSPHADDAIAAAADLAEPEETTPATKEGLDDGVTIGGEDNSVLDYDRCCFWNSKANQYACQPAGGSCTGKYELMRCKYDPPESNYSGDCCTL